MHEETWRERARFVALLSRCTRLEADDEDNTWLQNGPPGPCEALRLDLRYTELGRELLRNLPEARLWALQAPPGRRPREVVLNLWRCGLGDEGCRVLRRSLRQIGGRCEELRLGLADNAITAKGAELLAEGLGEMKVLTVLKLGLSRNPELGDAGCEALCRSLRQMPELRSLNLDWSDTGLGAEGCAALAAALRELRLQELARDFSDAVTVGAAASRREFYKYILASGFEHFGPEHSFPGAHAGRTGQPHPAGGLGGLVTRACTRVRSLGARPTGVLSQRQSAELPLQELRRQLRNHIPKLTILDEGQHPEAGY